MTAYYNEIDPYAAKWLENLIAAGHIAPGVVDTRSIEDVCPSDLAEFTQCHFFAGIGVWSYALRCAGWADDRPVWTGSCPCQPFSAAGKGAGFADERHLWPAFGHLIKERRPTVVLGEQVASKDVDPWIDLVHADLEAMGYAFGSVPFPSAGVGAPHIRDRNYWVGHAGGQGLDQRKRNARVPGVKAGSQARETVERAGIHAVRLADAANQRLDGWRAGSTRDGRDSARIESERLRDVGGLADSNGCGTGTGAELHDAEHNAEPRGGIYGMADDQLQQRSGSATSGDVSGGWNKEPAEVAGLCRDLRPGPTNGFWRNADWLGCTDGKWRPVEPGTFPLVTGAPGRVGRLRAYGNAINAEAAIAWIEAVMESA